jgi:DNA-directed RNA polymerase sigma subunit (sigma70/sigma32)
LPQSVFRPAFPEIPSPALYTDSVHAPLFGNDDSLEMYLREVRTILPLAKEEETKLLGHVRACDEQSEIAARTLVEANLSRVVSIVERYPSSKLSKLELIEEGNVGLMTAIDTFHSSANQNFVTHAETCIKQAISKAITK